MHGYYYVHINNKVNNNSLRSFEMSRSSGRELCVKNERIQYEYTYIYIYVCTINDDHDDDSRTNDRKYVPTTTTDNNMNNNATE